MITLSGNNDETYPIMLIFKHLIEILYKAFCENGHSVFALFVLVYEYILDNLFVV